MARKQEYEQIDNDNEEVIYVGQQPQAARTPSPKRLERSPKTSRAEQPLPLLLPELINKIIAERLDSNIASTIIAIERPKSQQTEDEYLNSIMTHINEHLEDIKSLASLAYAHLHPVSQDIVPTHINILQDLRDELGRKFRVIGCNCGEDNICSCGMREDGEKDVRMVSIALMTAQHILDKLEVIQPRLQSLTGWGENAVGSTEVT